MGASQTNHNLYRLEARPIRGEPLWVVAERVDLRGRHAALAPQPDRSESPLLSNQKCRLVFPEPPHVATRRFPFFARPHDPRRPDGDPPRTLMQSAMPGETIHINKAHYPVTVLGPGRRIGLWLQGCTLACPGCVSRDTWAFDPDRALPLPLLLAWCREVARAGLDGVTISGGEPFEQPAALATLLEALGDWRDAEGLHFDLLCYSGLPWSRLQCEFAPLLERLDAIIPEPFQARRPTRLLWRGSANQPLIPLSPLGRERYAPYRDREAERRPFQVVVDETRVWAVGLPDAGDMARLERRCAERGLRLGGVSWRA